MKDIRIIERLNGDGRASLRDVAEKLGISPSTVSNRFHALQDGSVIKRFQPVLDYEALGFGLTAIVEIKADPDRMEATVDALTGMDAVFSLYEVTGDTDIIMVCKFRDRSDMNDRVKAFQQVDGVLETKTNVAMTTPKEAAAIPLSDRLQEA